MRVILCLFIVLLSGCASGTFRDRANDYKTAQILPAVKVPAALAQKNTHTYDLPKIKKASTDVPVVDYVPPEFTVFEESE